MSSAPPAIKIMLMLSRFFWRYRYFGLSIASLTDNNAKAMSATAVGRSNVVWIVFTVCLSRTSLASMPVMIRTAT